MAQGLQGSLHYDSWEALQYGRAAGLELGWSPPLECLEEQHPLRDLSWRVDGPPRQHSALSPLLQVGLSYRGCHHAAAEERPRHAQHPHERCKPVMQADSIAY